MPLPAADNFLQRNTVSGAAPGGEENVRLRIADEIDVHDLAGIGYGRPSRSFNQLGDPGLGGDDRFAPFFAEDARMREAGGLLADAADFRLHAVNERGGAVGNAQDAGDHGDVLVYVGHLSRREQEDGNTGFQDFGDRLHLVGDRGDDQVWSDHFDLFGLCRPGVVEDEAIACFGAEVEAVLRAGDDAIQQPESGQGRSGARLEGRDALGEMTHGRS